MINPNSRHVDFIRNDYRTSFRDDYYHEDALVMEENSRDFFERVHKTNSNAEIVCEYLRSRSLRPISESSPPSESDSSQSQPHSQRKPVLKDVFYPKWISRENYDIYRRPSSSSSSNSTNTTNFGALFSLTFTSPLAAHAFYNALPCAKGPSLGTNFTLSCPYTILAHYHERGWAAEYGIEEGIVRVSVGMEAPGVLVGWMGEALDAAEAVGS